MVGLIQDFDSMNKEEIKEKQSEQDKVELTTLHQPKPMQDHVLIHLFLDDPIALTMHQFIPQTPSIKQMTSISLMNLKKKLKMS